MDNRALSLRVGLLVAAALALGIALVIWLGGQQLRRGTVYESYFRESVQGLNVGAPVKYRGVTVGQVTEIGLVAAEYKGKASSLTEDFYRMVYVRYRIDTKRMTTLSNAAEAIRQGLRARLASQGLTGLAYVELDFAPKAPVPPPLPWVPNAIVIPTIPSTLQQVQDAAEQLMTRVDKLDLEGLFNNMNGLITDLRQDLASGDVHTTLRSVQTLSTTLRQQVVAADLPGLVASLRASSASLRQLAAGRQTHEIMARANAASASLAQAAARLTPLIAALQGTVRHTGDSAADLTAQLAPILRDAAAAMAALRDVAQTMRRDPGAVLFAAPPPRQTPALEGSP